MQLRIDAIDFSYSSLLPLLEDFSWVLKPGVPYGLFGPSGRGKSTLLRIIAGLLAPQSGTIQRNDVSVYDLAYTDLLAYRGKTIGMHFQDHALLYDISAYENVCLPFLLDKKRGTMDEQWYNHLLAKLSLSNLDMNAPMHAFSGGQQERIGLMRALITQPNILLLDEPGANLNGELCAAVYDVLIEYARDHIVVAATHDENFTKITDALCYLD